MYLDSDSLFKRSNKLMEGILYEGFFEYKTFIHAKSVLKDAWYNYIIPKVGPSILNKKEVKRIIENEKKAGYLMSYYLNESILNDYYKYSLQLENFGDDVFISIKVTEPYKIENKDFVELTELNLEEYVSLAKSCFPDWENEEMYTRMFFNFGEKKNERILKTILIKEGNDIIAFGSVIIDLDLKLAYLHNSGTHERSRNKGYFSALVKNRCNIALEYGIKEVYAIVENGEGSYRVLSQLGFEVQETFHLYSAN